MGITTTLEKIGDKFAEWHTDSRTGKLHTAIYIEIDALKTSIESSGNDSNQLNQQLSNWIQQLIDGTSANHYSKISNSNNYNLAGLSNQIKTIESFLNREEFSSKTIKDYIDETVTSHDTGNIYYNKILENFLIQKDIESGDDLNNYLYGGFYRCINADISKNISNKPINMENSPFILIVLSPFETDDDKRTNKKEIIRQILLEVRENGTYGYEIYTRYCVSGKWTASWSKLYGSHNTSKKTMQVVFEDGSGTETWNILTI